MGRLVRAAAQLPPGKATGTAQTPDQASYTERVAKYIPGEVVAGYVAMSGLIGAVPESDVRRVGAAWVLFFIGLVTTPTYLYFSGKPEKPREFVQIIFPTIAFVLWAYALGGPFQMSSPLPLVGAYAPWLGAFALGIFTWIAGLFKP